MSGIFDGLFGNSAAKERFSAAIRSGTLPHAFLIDGPTGSGKTTLVYEIAAALDCERRGDESAPMPCRRCNTCRRIFEGSFTDIKTLDKPKDKASIGVEAVKDFKEDMFLTATEAEHKIYIIKNAHLLTPQAQNALLTVMEEPPPRVIIFLLSSSSDKILTTIKSRAQYVAMQKFPKDELSRYLKENVPEARALALSDPNRFAAALIRADGCIGIAKTLLDPKTSSEAEAERHAVKRIIAALDVRVPFSELYSALAELPDGRAELARAFEELISAISDMIKAKYAKGDVATEFFESTEEAVEMTKSLSQKRLFAVAELIKDSREYLTKNAAVATVISSLAAKIKLI